LAASVTDEQSVREDRREAPTVRKARRHFPFPSFICSVFADDDFKPMLPALELMRGRVEYPNVQGKKELDTNPRTAIAKSFLYEGILDVAYILYDTFELISR